MNSILKAGCIGVYLLATVATIVVSGLAVATVLQYLAVILVAAHVLELLVMFRFVRHHPGPLIDSIALTLLFGLLHWLPLKGSAGAARRARRW